MAEVAAPLLAALGSLEPQLVMGARGILRDPLVGAAACSCVGELACPLVPLFGARAASPSAAARLTARLSF